MLFQIRSGIEGISFLAIALSQVPYRHSTSHKMSSIIYRVSGIYLCMMILDSSLATLYSETLLAVTKSAYARLSNKLRDSESSDLSQSVSQDIMEDVLS